MNKHKNPIYDEMTNQYAMSKTLRNALVPVGKTLENIKQKGLLATDEQRAKDYQKVKKIMDEYHKHHIDRVLSGFSFDLSLLKKFELDYRNLRKDKSNDRFKKEFEKTQDKLRREVSSQLKDAKLFKKEFITEILPQWLTRSDITIEGVENPKELVAKFEKWNTYFEGFYKNRKNIYTAEANSTAIGYRLIHENLPKFIDNIDRYHKAKELKVDFSKIETTKNELDSVFTLAYFNNCLTQQGIDGYNLWRGRDINDKDGKKEGINQIINLKSQEYKSDTSKAKDEDKKKLNSQYKAIKSCKLEELYKQILSDRDGASFRFEEIENDAMLCAQLKMFRVENGSLLLRTETIDKETGEVTEAQYNITEAINNSIVNIKNADGKGIYIRNNMSLTNISQKIFGGYNLINQGLEIYAKTLFPRETKVNLKKQQSWVSDTTYFSFEEIEKGLKLFFEQYSEEELKANDDKDNDKGKITIKNRDLALNRPLMKYFSSLGNIEGQEEVLMFEDIAQREQEAQEVIEKYQNIEEKKLKSKDKDIAIIKAYLDAIKALQYFLSPLYITAYKGDKDKTDAYEKDNVFYHDFDQVYSVLQGSIIPLYNQTRNYVTQKAYSAEKYKLNFENETLAKGWDKNKETDNTCVMFTKNNNYYLGVMDKANKKLFKNLPVAQTKEVYQKMVYKLLPGASKMLPKVFFSAQSIAYYNPSPEIVKIRNHASHTKGGASQTGYDKKDFNLEDCHKMIDFYKDSIQKHPEWGLVFDFDFEDTAAYTDLSGFYRDVERKGYSISYENVDDDYINQCVDEGRMYLFQVYNKDFSPQSKGRPNLHTLYWKALFDRKNLAETVYKLNGEAALFYRPASIQYTDEIWKKGHHADDPKKKQQYPIVKDRRYAQDKFLFHVPTTMNFGKTAVARFNDKINTVLKNNPDVNIISIDRGERHLIYYTLINQKGEILKQESLNGIGGNDYHKILDDKEKGRDEARKNWGNIEKIKDLKAGYLSQVVHEICKMVIEHNAIIVLEDLNFGFKKGRFKVEKQIYQKFEKMLIDKLNYLVFKDAPSDQSGGLLKAYQLTAPFESFSKMGKQTGILYYVPAYHTSKICPVTGFVNLLYPKYETIAKSQIFFNKFDSITYNAKAEYFEFHITKYTDFNTKAKGCKQQWTICSHGRRLQNARDSKQNNQWVTKEVFPTEILKEALKIANIIDYSDGKCIKYLIVSQSNSQFFKDIIKGLRLTLQMRNSAIGKEEDWMISPVKDANGQFFNSEETKGNMMPKDADANGAYHIGLKGLMVLDRINQWQEGKKLNLAISNEDWYGFAQQQLYKK